MFDTMTGVKIVAGFCGTLLVFLLGNWAADLIYTGPEEHFAEGEGPKQAYTIPVEDAAASAAPAQTPEQEAAAFQEVFASADVARGESVFKPCGSCHSLKDGENKVGPSLYGVVGRAVDSEPGYAYSGALTQAAEVWDPEHLNHYLTNPKAAAPGTKMNFAGLRKVEDRAALIAWLATNPGG